jgi:hypothetical protein
MHVNERWEILSLPVQQRLLLKCLLLVVSFNHRPSYFNINHNGFNRSVRIIVIRRILSNNPKTVL